MKWIENSLYVADLMVRMAHHSTAIEGNTLTLGDSRSILINEIVPAKAKPLREIFEIANYKNLLPFLREQVEGAISYPLIQDIHQILLQNIDPRAGQFKIAENMILGASFLPVHPSQVIPSLIRWCDSLEYRLKQAASEAEKVEIIMDSHIRFEKIHPFSDGNGRTGRALIVFSCAREGLVPIIIEKEQRDEYIALLNNEDVKGLSEMAHTLQEKERVRLERALQCVPNAETVEAIKEVESMKADPSLGKTYSGVGQMMAELLTEENSPLSSLHAKGKALSRNKQEDFS